MISKTLHHIKRRSVLCHLFPVLSTVLCPRVCLYDKDKAAEDKAAEDIVILEPSSQSHHRHQREQANVCRRHEGDAWVPHVLVQSVETDVLGGEGRI